MSDIPTSVWIALVVAVAIFVLATRRLVNWPVVAAVLVLVLVLSRCDADAFRIPGLPMPSEQPSEPAPDQTGRP